MKPDVTSVDAPTADGRRDGAQRVPFVCIALVLLLASDATSPAQIRGYHEYNLNTVWSSADGIHWRELVSTPWAPRHATHVFPFAGALWVVGGSVIDSIPNADVWKLDAVPPLACDTTPRVGCTLAKSPAGSTLKLRDQTPDSGDAVVWHWRGDAPTDFGLPPGDTSLALCLYTEAASHMIGGALAAGLCLGKSCWDYTASAFKYRDPQLFAAGTQTLTLGNAHEAKIVLRGKSGLVGVPPLGTLAVPLTVQLQGTNGGCWEAHYSNAGVRQHTAAGFQAKSD
jgi:hypothetical protein